MALEVNRAAIEWLEEVEHIVRIEACDVVADHYEAARLPYPRPITSHALVEETDVMFDDSIYVESEQGGAVVVDSGRYFHWQPDPSDATFHRIAYMSLDVGNAARDLDSWPPGWSFSYSEEHHRTYSQALATTPA